MMDYRQLKSRESKAKYRQGKDYVTYPRDTKIIRRQSHPQISETSDVEVGIYIILQERKTQTKTNFSSTKGDSNTQQCTIRELGV